MRNMRMEIDGFKNKPFLISSVKGSKVDFGSKPKKSIFISTS